MRRNNFGASFFFWIIPHLTPAAGEVLVDWSVRCFCWLAGRLVRWFDGLFMDWLVWFLDVCLVDRLVGWSASECVH